MPTQEDVVYLKECIFNGQMDFEGQKRAYYFMLYTIWAFGFVGFTHGFIVQQFVITYYWIGVGTLIATVVTLPAWPHFLTNRIAWKEPPEEEQVGDEEEEEEEEKPKKKKKEKKESKIEDLDEDDGENKPKKRNKAKKEK